MMPYHYGRLRTLMPALFLTLGCSIQLSAQPRGSNDLLLEVGREKYTAAQIAEAYKRNANRGGKSFYELPRDSALAFLSLYANYRLKVQSAVDAEIDKRPDVIEDLRMNRIQLAVPPPPATGYLIERKVVDPAVERIFKQRDEELLIALIYKAVKGEDTTDAYRSTMAMIDQLRKGFDFSRMARDSSDDPNTKEEGGRLPTYITSGMILPEIENAAYKLRNGEVSATPIHLPGGYVIVKMIDRSPRVKVHAAHILIVSDPASPETGPERKHAESVLARIRNGEDFAKVAKVESDDMTSGENGGDFMGYYTRSLGFEAKDAKLEIPFQDALFKLKDGEISDIVRTRYGYHIIKRIDSRKPTFEEEKEKIRQFYKQRLIGDDRAAYVRSIVDKHGLRINYTIFNQMMAALNQRGTTNDSSWAAGIGGGLRREGLFTYGGTSYTVGSWIDSINTRPEFRSTPLSSQAVGGTIYRMFEQEAMIDEAKTLETEYPEFAMLMQEFRDGILIFNLEDEMVWKKLNKGYDEEKGMAFFESNRSNYMTAPKLALTEALRFDWDKEGADRAYKLVTARTGVFDSLAAETQRKDFRERGGRWPLNDARNADIVAQALKQLGTKKPKAGEILPPFPYQGGYSIVRIDQVEEPRRMNYEEAKPEVQSDYLDSLQKKLTEEWLDTLRIKYPVKVNDRTLKSILAAK